MTQLGIRSESVGAGDQSWLGSRHGTDTARSATLNPTAWTGKTTNGVIKSGEPFALASGLAVPYASGASDGTEVIYGFILTDTPVVSGAGNVTFPALRRGSVILSKLPSTVAATAKTSGNFTWEA